MMRYQRPSSDCFPLSNGRKPNSQPSIKPNTTITTYREDNHHHKHYHHHDNSGSSTRISTFESIKPSSVRVRSATPNPSTTSQDTHFPPFPTSTTPEPTTTSAKPNIHHDTNAIGAETTLPQWGHNKRSRGSRAENRLSGDDSSPGSGRHPVKIQRRSITVMMEKQQSTATITPPYSRGANLRSSTVSRDPPAILLSRNVEDRSNRPEKKRQHNTTTTTQKMHHKPSSTTHHHRQNHTFTPSASPAGGGRVVAGGSLNHSSTPSSEKETTTTATPPVAAIAGTTTTTTEKLNLDLFEWPRIYLSLSRKEKEDDFLAMKGTKLPQRPKKRAKNIDKSLQYCFPGMWLSDLTRGRYEVREKKCAKKRRRGLKGLESMDSDSD